jgi:hypothetical protein
MSWKAATLTLAAYAALFADTTGGRLTTAEVDHARQYLDEARDGVIEATKGLSEAQWAFKPAADRWSIAEIVEHIVVVQEFVLGPIRGQLANAPAPPAGFDARLVDAIIVTQFLDRSAKFQAPEPIRPSARWSHDVALERLRENTKKLAAYLESTPDLREHAVDAPPIKALTNGKYDSMDGYQWVLAAAGHAIRHTEQIVEVKGDSHFPR